MSLEKKIHNLKRLHSEAKEAHRVFLMKNGLLEDATKDLFVNELKFDKDTKELPLADILDAILKAAK